MILEVVVLIGAFALGRVTRANDQKTPRYCPHEWDERGGSWSCKNVQAACRSGLCLKHCKSLGCGCTTTSKLEQDVLKELREATRSEK